MVEVCEERYRIGRPRRPTPTATPTPRPDTGTPLPAPADADGDGVAVASRLLGPERHRVPGGEGGSGQRDRRRLHGRRRAGPPDGHDQEQVDDGTARPSRRLRVLDAPEGALVEVTCSGARCPFKRRSTSVNAKGNAQLLKFFKRHRLRPKITIDVRVTYPNWIGRVGRFAIKSVDVPDLQRLCLPPGAAKPQRC